MPEPIVLEERQGSIARLILNRPDARNSLSLQMLETLYEMIGHLGRDTSAHVIVLAANGPGFCAGHDLKELTAVRAESDKGRAFFEDTMGKCARLMMSIVRCPKPVIAEVHGIATAAGCQLVASCDLAVADAGAQFSTPGVHIGLFCSTPMVALSRNVGRKHAMRMLLTGDLMTASQAKDIGLISDIAPPAKLRQTTMALAERIAGKSPATLRIGKEAFYQQIEMNVPQAYEFASEVMVNNMMGVDAEEGIGAFIEKRVPNWQPL